MTIINFGDLHKWFMAQGRGEDKGVHWNLYATDYGQRDTRLIFNDRFDDPQESFDYLQTNIRMLNNPDGTKFRVQTFPPRKPTHPTGTALVQIFEKGSNLPSTYNVPTIAGLPATDIQEQIDKAVAEAQKTWEMEARIRGLEERLASPDPDDYIEKITTIVERVSRTPIGVAIMGIAAQKMGIDPAAIMGMATDADGQSDVPPEDDQFFSDMADAANQLGTDEHTLARKLKQLIKANPEMAQSLLK